MALLKCKECGKEISTEADKCPNCGAPVKKSFKIGCLGSIILIIIALLLIGQISECNNEASKKRAQRTEQETAKKAERERVEKERIAAERKQREKESFQASIEDRYLNLLILINVGNNEHILKALEEFEYYDQLAYKDVDKLFKKFRIAELEKKASGLPKTSINDNLEAYNKLLQLDPANKTYKKKAAFYNAEYQKLIEREELRQQKANSDLELLSWNWGSDYGYVTAQGQVRNISGRKLERVQALVTWYDGNGNMVTSDSSLIDYDPIMPGQTSPFKVMERYNPAMKKASIEFKYMWGDEITTYHQKK